jgi:hypothetical protein
MAARRRIRLPAQRGGGFLRGVDRATRPSSTLHALPAGIIAMQSTGQGATQSSQPVQTAASTVCIRFAAPTIASTGHASMQSVQPMQVASSIRAMVSRPESPQERSSATAARPVIDASWPTTVSAPGGHRLISAPSAIASAYGRQPS